MKKLDSALITVNFKHDFSKLLFLHGIQSTDALFEGTPLLLVDMFPRDLLPITCPVTGTVTGDSITVSGL